MSLNGHPNAVRLRPRRLARGWPSAADAGAERRRAGAARFRGDAARAAGSARFPGVTPRPRMGKEIRLRGAQIRLPSWKPVHESDAQSVLVVQGAPMRAVPGATQRAAQSRPPG